MDAYKKTKIRVREQQRRPVRLWVRHCRANKLKGRWERRQAAVYETESFVRCFKLYLHIQSSTHDCIP